MKNIELPCPLIEEKAAGFWTTLLLGKDTYAVATAKLGDMLNDIENWKETTVSTDFEE
ncbi:MULTISPECIES: hypothetical protein [Paenibacillus]|uniref:Uncharacterized protein n=1 Tax=Paenibacillus cineris TaxID=237530 RepID=A0ABQ4LKD8_9BACL|nr:MULTISPECIES: hypothetical protein [Paenibacillus]UYO06376.1 hypothetical protein K2F33_11085 [Paenibacillus sp. PSB04]GIO56989.1 hypothetical protein J21TS7_53070 [Paenibacillus cineris]